VLVCQLQIKIITWLGFNSHAYTTYKKQVVLLFKCPPGSLRHSITRSKVLLKAGKCSTMERKKKKQHTLVLILRSVAPHGQFTCESSGIFLVVFEKEVAAVCTEQLPHIPTSSFHLAVHSCLCLVTFIASNEFSMLL